MYNFYFEECWDVSFEYNGSVAVTEDGLACPRWDLQYPHSHSYTDPGLYPDTTIELANNYCRDPDVIGIPWCYTIDPDIRWQLCSVPDCNVFGMGLILF